MIEKQEEMSDLLNKMRFANGKDKNEWYHWEKMLLYIKEWTHVFMFYQFLKKIYINVKFM